MDFTLDDNTHAQVLKLRNFIKKELQPPEDEVEAKGVLDSNTAIEIFEKSRSQGFYGMNIPAECRWRFQCSPDGLFGTRDGTNHRSAYP